ncbi:MAG: hypothetical protein QUS08_05635, partial [Methanothrix sp.]|nr:hypothetical protein [Methanothrix sp.]
MRLKDFMEDAYQGKTRRRRLQTHRGEVVFGLEDLADRVGERPHRSQVEELVPHDRTLLERLLSERPGRRLRLLWGLVSSIAADSDPSPLRLQEGDYAGLELHSGTILLQRGGDHVGEGMRGGRVLVRGPAGDYLGQEMAGGRIAASCCGDYAFRRMRGGIGVVLGGCGNYLGVGLQDGRIAVRGGCGERAGWMMRGGRVSIAGDAGDYLGLLMRGGELVVRGRAGRRAGWRRRGGVIRAGGFGPEAAEGVLG